MLVVKQVNKLTKRQHISILFLFEFIQIVYRYKGNCMCDLSAHLHIILDGQIVPITQ